MWVTAPHERPDGLIWVREGTEVFSDVWMIEDFNPACAAQNP